MGPDFLDEDGDEVCFGCDRPEGHTGRHFAWEWARGGRQAVHVWDDEMGTYPEEKP